MSKYMSRGGLQVMFERPPILAQISQLESLLQRKIISNKSSTIFRRVKGARRCGSKVSGLQTVVTEWWVETSWDWPR